MWLLRQKISRVGSGRCCLLYGGTVRCGAIVWVFRCEESCVPSCCCRLSDLIEGEFRVDELIQFVFERCTEFFQPFVNLTATTTDELFRVQVEVEDHVRVDVEFPMFVSVLQSSLLG